MFSRFLAILILLVLPLEALPKDLRLSSKVTRELEKIPAFQEASKAMADRLPNVAAEKFRLLLETPKLSKAAKSAAELMLAEALIRASAAPNGDQNLAADALKLLTQKELQNFSTALIWKAEALAVQGQYAVASSVLKQIPSSNPNYSIAQLANAKILIALNRKTEALSELTKTIGSKNKALANTAAMLAAELAIDTEDYDTAKKLLAQANAERAETTKLKEYLAARMALKEGEMAKAANIFQSLINAPEPLSQRLFLSSHLGLADAQASATPEKAVETLLNFIESHPNAYNITKAFDRLIALLPEEIQEDHPALLKLREWSQEKKIVLTPELIPLNDNSVIGLTPEQGISISDQDLAALSLFYRAKILSKSEKNEDLEHAIIILARLRVLTSLGNAAPSGLYLDLFSASLLETAYIHLKLENPDMATFTLSAMEKITFSPNLKSQAIILRGEILANNEDYAAAMQAFLRARASSATSVVEAANLNAGIMALKSANLTAFDDILLQAKDEKIRQSLTLERALWMSYQGDQRGLFELDKFIMANEGHPRENEARLALASACVNITPPDLKLAKRQLEIITPRLIEPTEQAQITRILIRAESLLQDWEQAAKAAESFLQKFPASPTAPAIEFKRGEAYFHNEDYNKARIVFQEFKKKYPKNDLISYTDFYAAMSARLSGTEQSREECIEMFQEIIKSKHDLASEARIQQGRVLIDMGKYEQAHDTLTPLFENKKTPPERKLGAGVLLADCYQREGNLDPDKNKKAVSIYNQLLKIEQLSPAWTHRLHYLRGQAYENMKDTAEAFKSFYAVIIQSKAPDNIQGKQEEWFWFYRNGFKALAMLENAKRWEAAVKLAKRIAAFNGPRAEEAAKRAEDLAKKHMIWPEDEPLD